MNKKLLVIAVCALFLISLAYTMPVNWGMNVTASADEFSQEHINPVMEIDINLYYPELKASLNKSYTIQFAEMQPLKTTNKDTDYTPDRKVIQFTDESPAQYLQDYDEMQTLYQVEHWADGHITKTPVPKQGLQEKANGYRYEGWFPSVDLMARYIAYLEGAELNYINAGDRNYQTAEGNGIVDCIYEQELPYMNTPTNFEEMSAENPLIITQQGYSFAKDFNLSMQGPEPTTKNMQMSLRISDLTINNTTIKIAPALALLIAKGIIALIVAIAGIWIISAVCNMWIQTDSTPYGLPQLAAAHEAGFGLGANETAQQYEGRLKDLLLAGKISNETYVLLLNQLKATYNNVMTNYKNPYEGLQNPGGANSWIQTIITILKTVMIIAIIIFILWIAVLVIRKLPFLKGKHESESYSLVPSSSNAIQPIVTLWHSLNFFGIG